MELIDVWLSWKIILCNENKYGIVLGLHVVCGGVRTRRNFFISSCDYLSLAAYKFGTLLCLAS
jgi:hypothetical protein